MKKLILGVLAFSLLQACGPGIDPNGQRGLDPLNVRWMKQLGLISRGTSASGTETATPVTDSSGNLYICGTTNGSLADTAGGAGGDVFGAKFDSAGRLVWIRQLGATVRPSNSSGDEIINRGAVDSSGNLYCAGQTTGNAAEANAGSYDAVVVKFDSNGAFQWTRQWGTTTGASGATGNDQAQAVTIDSSGNLYVAGVTAGNLYESNSGAGTWDAWIAKLDASTGAVTWGKQLGNGTLPGKTSMFETPAGISVDAAGNVFIGGHTNGAIADTNGSGNYDAFIAKWNSGGTFQWAKQLGSGALPGKTDSNEYVYAFTVDSQGNAIIGGITYGNLDDTLLGVTDGFVVKWNGSGDLKWVTQLGTNAMGADMVGEEYLRGVATDSAGNVFFGGYTLGKFTETNGGSGTGDLFWGKIDMNGNPRWAKQLGAVTLPTTSSGSSAGYERINNSIALSSAGYLYLVGTTDGAFAEANAGTNDVIMVQAGQ